MSNDINLLTHKPLTLSRSFTKRVKIIRFVAMLLLFIVPIGTIILFLFIFFSPLPSLQQKERSLLTSAAILQQKTASVAFINDRATKSIQFIAKRNVYRKALQELIAQLPSDATISSLSMQANKITFIIMSPSLNSLKTYQDDLANSQGSGDVLHAITFQTLTFVQDNTNYQMTLAATIHE